MIALVKVHQHITRPDCWVLDGVLEIRDLCSLGSALIQVVNAEALVNAFKAFISFKFISKIKRLFIE